MPDRILAFTMAVFYLGQGAFCHGALFGNNFEIAPAGRFPDVAYGNVSRQYLVVWADYSAPGGAQIFGRLLRGDGSMAGAAFGISDAGFPSLFPAVAYNAASNEFLVTWDDGGGRGGVIYGQRVSGTDGARRRGNFAIGSVHGGIRSAVASSSNSYLVVYWGPGSVAPEVYGNRVSAGGSLLGPTFNISNDGVFSGYPAISWAPAVDQFLVTWDNEDGNIHGRRIEADTGQLLGAVIPVTMGGGKDRSCIAYSSVTANWLVQYNHGANAGFSYDQYAQLVDTAGRLAGGPIAVAHTPGFEGDTQFGGDVAFDPGARRFFSSFGTDNGMGGQELLLSGALLGPQLSLGTGFYTSLNNAADPDTHRFLTTWEGSVGGSFRIFGQLYAATLGSVGNFTASASNGAVVLNWRNPTDAHFRGTMIRAGTSGYPSGAFEGLLIVDRAGVGGMNDHFTHTAATNWTTYYYAAFAHDDGANYAPAAHAAATPRPQVVTLANHSFQAGAEGWMLATWAAGTLAPGAVAWSAASIVFSGSGLSNNRDACTREGAVMSKAISTVGYGDIQIEYDVMAELHAAPTGSPGGSCSLLEGSAEDKLVLSYSTAGLDGPWTVAQTLVEGAELPTGWTRRFINLAGVPGTANNPNFALRFQWQFNTGNDTGRVDNVRVLSGAIVAQSPAIGLSASVIERTILAGQNPTPDRLVVNNTGLGLLEFTAAPTAAWLGLSPPAATSAGPDRVVLLHYNTAGLSPGEYQAQIEVAAAAAVNSPQWVTVRLRVMPAACFWEPFSYYNGTLVTMGAANWTGSASHQLLLGDGVLCVAGGAGQVSASRAVSCAGSNGVIAAQIKIKRGMGTGDFFWNIAFDDSSGNNLARWYGGSTIARGRVGGEITTDLVLSGLETWDDLYLRMNTSANTSEFFFNGLPVGVISHGPTAGNSIATVRLERLDRASAVGDSVYFDDLRLGPAGHMPARLEVTRSGNTVRLSWPATGAGFELQTSPALLTPWSSVAATPGFASGKHMLSATAAQGSSYYRLRAR